MNLTREKEILKNWLAEQEEYIDSRFSMTNEESYWRQREKSSGVEEYHFETLGELKQQLGFLWEDEPEFKNIELPIAVATFKAKDERKVEEEVVDIPEFVYAF